MESIREIIVPENNKIELTIPDNFIGKRIEVIAFEAESRENGLKEKTFDAIKLNLTGFKFNREEANDDIGTGIYKKLKRPFKVVNVKVENYKFNREEANRRK